MSKGLYRITIVIWSDEDPTHYTLEDVAREATSGGMYCSRQEHEYINDPQSDPFPPSQEFFFDTTEGA
jgi:hypothetical protein